MVTYMKKILSATIVSLVVLMMFFNTNKKELIKNISGHLTNEKCEIIYTANNKTYNILSISEKNGECRHEINEDQYEEIAGIIVQKDIISKLCKEQNVESINDICSLYGQPVWFSKKYLIFDGWSINQNNFCVFDLFSNTQIYISKKEFNEIIVSVYENENSIQVFTDLQVYNIKNNIIDSREYLFNENMDLGYYDYAETDIFKYRLTDDILAYATNTYVFGRKNNGIEKYCTFFSIYSMNKNIWHTEKIENKIVLNYFIENNSLFVICVGNNSLHQLEVLKYGQDKNSIWSLEQSYFIGLPEDIQYVQDNHLKNSQDYLIYYPYSLDGKKRYVFLIEKNNFTMSFSGYMDTNVIGEIHNVSIIK